MLKQVQTEQSDSLMNVRTKMLGNVIKKNTLLVESVPEAIAGDNVKKEFLKQRKNLMIRLIHSELRNKKISEWTMKSLTKIQRDSQLSTSQRPKCVVNYLAKKQE